MKALDDAARSFRTTGAKRTAQRLFQRLVPSEIFDVNRGVVIAAAIEALSEERKDAPPRPELEHRWATAQDFEILKSGGLTTAEVQKYLDAGARAVITTTNGELAGYYWAVPRCWDHWGWLRFRVAPNVNWGGHNFVMPAHRGKRIAGETSNFAFEQLRAEGFVRSIGLVEFLNQSSIHVWSSPASKVIGYISYFRLGPLVVYRKNGKWGAGFYAGGRPLEINVDDLEAEYLASTRACG